MIIADAIINAAISTSSQRIRVDHVDDFLAP